jgi:hypothetical protein
MFPFLWSRSRLPRLSLVVLSLPLCLNPFPSGCFILHRPCRALVWNLHACCLNVIHFSRYVGHQNCRFSTLRASPISVHPLQTWIHNIFNVIKCHHLYRQLPSSSVCSLPEPRRKWLNVAHSDAPRRWPFFIPHPSSLILSNVGGTGMWHPKLAACA